MPVEQVTLNAFLTYFSAFSTKIFIQNQPFSNISVFAVDIYVLQI